jgi:hypothetical protein
LICLEERLGDLETGGLEKERTRGREDEEAARHKLKGQDW